MYRHRFFFFSFTFGVIVRIELFKRVVHLVYGFTFKYHFKLMSFNSNCIIFLSLHECIGFKFRQKIFITKLEQK